MALTAQKKPVVQPVTVNVDRPALPTLKMPGSLAEPAQQFNNEMSQWWESDKQAMLEKLNVMQNQINTLAAQVATLTNSLNTPH